MVRVRVWVGQDLGLGLGDVWVTLMVMVRGSVHGPGLKLGLCFR